MLWFGFGVQHPIRHLERTENGYSLIALCAALSTISPDLEAAAVILTELTDIKGAPQYLRPSLQQWHDMAKSCSGSLISTNFECIANQYMLLSGTLRTSDAINIGEPHYVAVALNAIGSLSRGEIASITLAGGSVCGWLAAWAHVFFNLDIELQDKDRNTVLKTVAERDSVHILVLFGEHTSSDVQLSSTTYSIRDNSFIKEGSYLVRPGRVPWDQAIQRAFGAHGMRLLKARRAFSTMIGSTARILVGVTQNDENILNLLHSDVNDHFTGTFDFHKD